jgi:prepilin-type N-terminal cleavage/methylation domain-containing protein
MKIYSTSSSKGFTLLEILLVIAAIGILAAIVLVAINPNRQLAQARNAQRRSDVTTISNAVYQRIIDDAANNLTTMNTALVDNFVYAIGTSGTATTVEATCATLTNVNGTTATRTIDLATTLAPNFLASIPFDPRGGSTACTGYVITQSGTPENGRITVTAPIAGSDLAGSSISVTR